MPHAPEVEERFQRFWADAALLHARAGMWG
jgi:hypothetical protein